MKKVVKLLCMVLTAVMLITGAYGCGTNSGGNDTGTTVTEKTTTEPAKTETEPVEPEKVYEISYMSPWGGTIEKDTPVQKKLEELLNVKFNIMPVMESYEDKLNLLLASGEYPDLYWLNDVEQKYKQEVLPYFDKDFLNKNMPVSTKVIDEIAPSIWPLFMRDGKFVAFPRFWMAGGVPNNIIWREDLFNAAGVDKLPDTIDEVSAAFAKFRAKYPDKYPLSARGKGFAYGGFSFVFGAYGAQPNFWTIKDGKIVYGFTVPEMKQAFALLQDWYKKGYIDKDWVNLDGTQWKNNFKNGKNAIFGTAQHTDTWIGKDSDPNNIVNTLKQLEPDSKPTFLYPPKGPNGARSILGPANLGGTTQIAGAVGFGKHLENDLDKFAKCMEVIDRIATDEECYTTANYGIKGTHWDPDPTTGVAVYKEGNKTEEEKAKVGDTWFWIIQSPDLFSPLFEKYSRGPELTSYIKSEYGRTDAAYPDLMAYRVMGETWLKSADELNRIFNEFYFGVIVGEIKVDDYEKYVDMWYKAGGDKVTEEINALHAKDLIK